MSLRVARTIEDVLRRHLQSSLRTQPRRATVDFLKDLAAFHEATSGASLLDASTPYRRGTESEEEGLSRPERSTHDAVMKFEFTASSNSAPLPLLESAKKLLRRSSSGDDGVSTTANASSLVAEVPLSLWNSVFPWECATGLSHAPPASLLLPEAASSCSSPPPPEKGMLFLQPPLTARGSPQPATFWCGAITAPIDIAFLHRSDSFHTLREHLATGRSGKGNRSDSNELLRALPLRGDGITLSVEQHGFLLPGPQCQACDRLTPAQRRQLRLDQHPFPQDPKIHRTIRSNKAGHHLVLELRRYFFEEQIQKLFGDSYRQQHPSNGGGVAGGGSPQRRGGGAASPGPPPQVAVSLVISETLESELHAKLMTYQQFVRPLEATIERLLLSCNHAVDLYQRHHDGSREGEEQQQQKQRGEEESVRAGENSRNADSHGKWNDASREPDGEVPAQNVHSTFHGRQSGDEAARMSAKVQSRYIPTSPDVSPLPPLDYELLTLAIQCSLGWEAIYQLLDRATVELTRGQVGKDDVSRLVNLKESLLLLPSEFQHAVSFAARRANL